MMTKYCIGVDIGGTKTSIGVVDTNKGKVIINKIIKSKATTNDQQNLNNIILETTNLINKFKSQTNFFFLLIFVKMNNAKYFAKSS